MSCVLCGGALFAHLEKLSASGKVYKIMRCEDCSVWQVSPMPSADELLALYQSEYFKTRSDRGYADYASEKIYLSVVSTLEKNLADLDFYAWEKANPDRRDMLEVGCAAGHAVDYFARRSWSVLGIDVAREMVEAGKGAGRNLIVADFLQHDFAGRKYDSITHWATLEHLPQATEFLQKMASLLKPGGKIFLSTCNTGVFARIRGRAWRYLNVPEHVFYFNKKSLDRIAGRSGLKVSRAFSYGSGFTTRAGAGPFYRITKAFADKIARFCLSGDMIVVELTRIAEN